MVLTMAGIVVFVPNITKKNYKIYLLCPKYYLIFSKYDVP